MTKTAKILLLSSAIFSASFLVRPVLAESREDMIACTMEAKLCPDCSYVSRTGPHCQFAPCPGENGSTRPQPIPEPPPPDRVGEPVPGGVPGVSPGNPGPDTPIPE